MTRALLVGALGLALLHFALELVGGRSAVAMLVAGTSDPASTILGVGYALSRFGLVVVAPIALVTALLLVASKRLFARS